MSSKGRLLLVASIAVFVLALLWVGAEGVGCGEPLLTDTDSCSDWQCSRAATAGVRQYCLRGLEEHTPCIRDADCYHNLECSPVTPHSIEKLCKKKETDKTAWVGFTAAGMAVVAFGSNFIPAKKCEVGNGVFFQFGMSLGILTMGIAVQLIRESPTIYPKAMIGGIMWAVGNVIGVPAIRFIGMGLAITTWGITNMMMGWASGKFGLFGISKEEVSEEYLSYLSVGIACLGLAIVALVKPSTGSKEEKYGVDEDTTRVYDRLHLITNMDAPSEHVSPYVARTYGFVLALIAGLLFGLNFNPPQSLIDNYADKSLHEDVKYSYNGLDYVFSHFLGIFFASLVFCVCNVATESKGPSIFPTVEVKGLLIPGFISGFVWAIGQTSWFVANTHLGLVISFPIICLGPSFIASMWGIFLFREIRGTKNIAILCLAFVLIGASCACTALAKE